jgi:pimeloyl-ACP methyl ester carboxylesterase
VAPFLQFPELGTEFEVWGMTIPMEDRSSIDNLCNQVLSFIDEKCNESSRPLYLMGESFGGILALEVSLALHERKINFAGLVLINPATCYKTSNLAISGPPVANGSPILYPINLMSLIPLFTDDYALPQLIKILQAEGLPSVIDTAQREAYMGRVAFSLPSKLKFMPQNTLKWRLEEWLMKGCDSIESKGNILRERLRVIPILIVAGEKDNTLPSVEESKRLAKQLSNVDIYVVSGSGHACTSGSRVDLTALMRNTFSDLSLIGRKNMKEAASLNKGVSFGLEKRYDDASIGLMPYKYWSREYYDTC